MHSEGDLRTPGRDLLRHHHPAGDPPRHLHLGQGTDPADPGLHHPLEQQPRTFVWTATTDEILTKVLITQTNVKKLVENKTK